MASAHKQLYWIRNHKVPSSLLRKICAGQSAACFVFCTENEARPDLTALRHAIRKFGKELIEMPGDPETVVPSLARVLKVDEVILLSDQFLTAGTEKVHEVRHRLNMHSITFKEAAGKTPIHTTLKSIFPALDWFSDSGLHRLPPAF